MTHDQDLASLGQEMYDWAKALFPTPRSITGPGVRQTLDFLKQHLPDLTVHAVASGTTAFDWTVPDEWTIRDAYIADQNGQRLVDFKQHNLHIMGYSEPVDAWLTREELEPHLYSLPHMPDAIPYVTSYYKRTWGFCLSHEQRLALPPGPYHVVIDSDLQPGVLNYGELILPGQEKSEVLLSTYVCHPSMANNELSGPVVTTALARWLSTQTQRRHTYRIVFLPETIGSIVYLSRHYQHMKQHTIAGYVVSCVGDDRTYSYLASRQTGTLADRVALHVLKHMAPDFQRYSFFDRGSDERQYCAPGIDLPVCLVMRSKFGTYPEYHTSKDNLQLISPSGLAGGFEALRRCISLLEVNHMWQNLTLCEPQLGKRGLYPTTSTCESGGTVRAMTNVLAYADGSRDLIDLADTIGGDAFFCHDILQRLAAVSLVQAL